ncbi:DUF1223 domain-containing protein [Roseibium denhamense]|uniref:DUF1223 domain-containing protein n=1 Tax=Roseibium denhamense TaxID=76305 RepID=A0ABY1P9W1_9HYPH|nr:DUF1223 domain-containing protein [Roseibium denhamense]MTI07377.1 DUF1223 domain-containing protein [Roseibium denhamense]SMP29201.1 hypothetical protein SAMN06265374_3067 [Roseibium denhamense]
MVGPSVRGINTALRAIIFVFSGFIASGAIVTGAAAQPAKVIELFTSQGCSSCPPADALAERLVAEDKDVLTLLMPVDYWDYLGWKDTLANPVYSQRQRAYAVRRGDRSVYTPQMVINGGEHVIGSREKDVRAALKRADPFTSSVSLKISDMTVEATVEGALPDGAKMATVYFLRIEEEVSVEIGRGENAGRQIRYVNVVRDLQPMGMWSGGTETFRMPKSKLMNAGNARCAILVQIEDTDGPGRVVGAAVMDWRKGF